MKVTFDPGTGDAPDGYYVLYFTKDTHWLSAIRYIVSYPWYFKKGEHLPENFMEVIGENSVNGILFPTDYKTHWLTDNQKLGGNITKIEVSDVHFIDTLKNDFLICQKLLKSSRNLKMLFQYTNRLSCRNLM